MEDPPYNMIPSFEVRRQIICTDLSSSFRVIFKQEAPCHKAGWMDGFECAHMVNNSAPCHRNTTPIKRVQSQRAPSNTISPNPRKMSNLTPNEKRNRGIARVLNDLRNDGGLKEAHIALGGVYCAMHHLGDKIEFPHPGEKEVNRFCLLCYKTIVNCR